jgi:hypothetical protein
MGVEPASQTLSSILFCFCMFNDAVSIVLSNDRTNNELGECVRKRSWPNVWYYIGLEELRITTMVNVGEMRSLEFESRIVSS